MRVERLRWWHIEQVTPIEADVFGIEQWSAEMFWNELASGHYYIAVLDDETHTDRDADRATGDSDPAAGDAAGAGQLLGYAGLSLAPPDEAWVQTIAVGRDAQRRGIGRTLLEELLAEAGRRSARKVLLEVAVDNDPAQKLYARYGFEPIAVRRGYYQPSNTDALVMLREPR